MRDPWEFPTCFTDTPGLMLVHYPAHSCLPHGPYPVQAYATVGKADPSPFSRVGIEAGCYAACLPALVSVRRFVGSRNRPLAALAPGEPKI